MLLVEALTQDILKANTIEQLDRILWAIKECRKTYPHHYFSDLQERDLKLAIFDKQIEINNEKPKGAASGCGLCNKFNNGNCGNFCQMTREQRKDFIISKRI